MCGSRLMQLVVVMKMTAKEKGVVSKKVLGGREGVAMPIDGGNFSAVHTKTYSCSTFFGGNDFLRRRR